MREAYLHELQPAYLKFCPDSAASPKAFLNLPPCTLHPTSGEMVCFRDPGMGSMFVDEPGLNGAQYGSSGGSLAGLKSIKTNDF